MSENRQWMYRRFLSNGDFNPEFLSGLDSFIKFASSKPTFMDRDKIRCACKKCDNKWYRDTDEVEYHLSKFGFTRNYDIWRFHGETSIPTAEDRNMDIDEDEEAFSPYHTMVMDAAGPQFNIEDTEETPNPEAQLLYDMLNAADNELWPGCKKYSQLSFLVHLMSLKADSHMSERHYDRLTNLLQDAFPEDNLIPDNFYSTKKLLRGIGLPVEKIDCCPNSCMIYWRGDSELERCKFCNTSRFKDNSRESGSRKKKLMRCFSSS